MPTRAALYARISVNDKKVPAIANQLANLKKLAEAEGYTVVRSYFDDGISAYSGKERPGFLDLVRGIKARNFDVVLAVAEDRFSRSSAEKIGFQSECVRAGVTWHTLASGKVDPSTAEGGLLATITGALAQYESTLKAERLQRSVSDRLADGKDLGGPRPFGFEKDRKTIREEEAELVRQGARDIMNGATVMAVAKRWTETGISPSGKATRWRTQTVRSILLRPRNVGRLVVKGVDYGRTLPPIMDDDMFEAVRAILEDPARRPRRGPEPAKWTAIRLVRCGVCGSYLSLTVSNTHPTVRCGRDPKHGTVVPAGAHPQMRAQLLEDELRARAMSKVVARAIHANAEDGQAPTESADVAAIRADLTEAERQREAWQVQATWEGADLSRIQREVASLGTQIDGLQRSLDTALARVPTAAAVEHARRHFRVMVSLDEDAAQRLDLSQAAEGWAKYWRGLYVGERRQLMRGLFETIELVGYRRGHSEQWGRLRLDGKEPGGHLTD